MLRPNLIDHLPRHILSMMRFENFDLEITLQGYSCNGIFPTVEIFINKQLEFTSCIDHKTINLNKKFDSTVRQVTVDICYLGKTDADTRVDHLGQIIENQSLEITGLTINQVDIISSQSIYKLGNYTQNLSEEKKAYFLEHKIDIGPSHSLHMFENGVWNINLGFPILPELCKIMSVTEVHQKSLNYDQFDDMYQRIQHIKQLEQLVAEKETQKVLTSHQQ
jgi:hypothetical protein